MTILIPGGAGFVGSNLCFNLKQKYPNYKIIALDNLKRRGSELNLKRFKEAGIEFIHGDIRSFDDLSSIKCDVIIECSAEPSVLAGMDGARKYLIDTNLNGLVNLLEVAMRNSAKMIFLSSSRIYPMAPINELKYTEEELRYKLASSKPYIANEGFNELFPISGARTLYGATKLSAELIIEEYSHMFGLEYIVNRCGVIAGAWQFGKVDQGFMTLWCANHYFKNPLTIFGNGKQVRDVLNVNDLFELVDKQLHSFGLFKNQTFNAGGGIKNSVSLLELENICNEVVGKNSLSFSEPRGLDLLYYVTDNTKVNSVCGWEPKKDAKDTVQDIFLWIKENEKELKWIFA